MLALKMLLTVAGVLMLAAACAIPLYGLWLRMRRARRKAAGRNEFPRRRDRLARAGGTGDGGVPAAADRG